MLLYEGKGKSKVLIKFLLNFRQSGDVLFFLNVRRLRGYTATAVVSQIVKLIVQNRPIFQKLLSLVESQSYFQGKTLATKVARNNFSGVKDYLIK